LYVAGHFTKTIIEKAQ